MLQRRQRVLNRPRRPPIQPLPQMHHHVPQRNVLGRLQRPFHLVHRVNPPRLLRMQYVHRRRSRPPHLTVRIQRAMHRERLQRIGPEPVPQLRHMLAARVVEVLPRGINLHRLRAATRGKLQQSRMQSLIQKKMSRKYAQHESNRPRAGPPSPANRSLLLLSHHRRKLPPSGRTAQSHGYSQFDNPIPQRAVIDPIHPKGRHPERKGPQTFFSLWVVSRRICICALGRTREQDTRRPKPQRIHSPPKNSAPSKRQA